jgi:hypothetical protein
MSANLSATALGWSQLYTNQPKVAADTAQSWAQLPLLQAQTGETQARIPWTQAQTTKTQLEADMQRIQNQMKGIPLSEMLDMQRQGANRGAPIIQDDPALYNPPPGASTTTPPPAARPASSALPRITAPDPTASSTSTAMNTPIQLAQADTGSMSDVGPQLYSPGYQPVARPTPQGAIQLAQAGTPQPVAPPPLPTAPPPGAAPPGAQPGAQGGQPAQLAPGGYWLDGVGPVSRQMRLDYLMALANGQNTAETRRIISAQRYQRLAELAGGATSPADWNYRVMSAWGEGLLTTHDRDTLYGHFENKDNFVDKLQTAAEQTRAAIDRTQQGLRLTPQGLQVDPTAVAGQEETAAGRARGGGQVQTITLPDKDHPGQFTEVPVPLGYTLEFFRTYMQEYQRQHGGALPPRSEAAPSGGPGASTNITRNNPGNLTYAGQPGATSVPGDRFAHFPNVATGIAASATQLAINQDTHGVNSVADQVKQWVHEPGADLKTYIADTAAALGVDPSAKVDWHDPNVQAKFLTAMQPHETGGKSAYLDPADVRRGVQMAAARRSTANQYAGPGVPPEGSPAAAIAEGMVRAGAAPGTLTAGPPGSGLRTGSAAAPEVQPTQVAEQNPYGFPGHPIFTPPQTAATERDTALINEDTKTISGIGAGQLALDQSLSSMHDVLNRVDDAITGPGADWRKKLSAVASQFGAGWVQDFAKKLSDGNIDPSKAVNSEIVMKQLFLSSQQAESQLLQHGGLGSSQLYAAMFPNPNMLPGSIKEMTNFLTMMQLRTRDWNQGAMEHYNKNYDIRAGATDPTTGSPMRYQPVSKFTQGFNAAGSEHAPQVYGGAVAIMNGKSPSVWTRGLSDDQQWAAIQAAKRADPGYKFDKDKIPKRFGGTAED